MKSPIKLLAMLVCLSMGGATFGRVLTFEQLAKMKHPESVSPHFKAWREAQLKKAKKLVTEKKMTPEAKEEARKTAETIAAVIVEEAKTGKKKLKVEDISDFKEALKALDREYGVNENVAKDVKEMVKEEKAISKAIKTKTLTPEQQKKVDEIFVEASSVAPVMWALDPSGSSLVVVELRKMMQELAPVVTSKAIQIAYPDHVGTLIGFAPWDNKNLSAGVEIISIDEGTSAAPPTLAPNATPAEVKKFVESKAMVIYENAKAGKKDPQAKETFMEAVDRLHRGIGKTFLANKAKKLIETVESIVESAKTSPLTPEKQKDADTTLKEVVVTANALSIADPNDLQIIDDLEEASTKLAPLASNESRKEFPLLIAAPPTLAPNATPAEVQKFVETSVKVLYLKEKAGVNDPKAKETFMETVDRLQGGIGKTLLAKKAKELIKTVESVVETAKKGSLSPEEQNKADELYSKGMMTLHAVSLTKSPKSSIDNLKRAIKKLKPFVSEETKSERPLLIDAPPVLL